MRASLPPILAVAGALVLAGCLGSGAPPPATQPEQPTATPDVAPPVRNATPAPAPMRAIFPFQGHLTLSVGADGVGYVSPTGSADPHIFTFKVARNATAIVAELRWSDSSQDLDLELGTPDCDSNTGTGTCVFDSNGTLLAGDSPVKLVFTDPAALNKTGDWKLYVWGKDAVNADFDAAATVFYGMAPSADYTAFKPS